jgi:prolyl-tRNA synthetase
MGVKVLDEKGKPLIPTMGCYGIGVNRCLATIIEQSNDDKGIAWPISLAPFEVCLVSISKSEEEIQQVNKIYEYLNGKGIDILWDDRDLGAGFKFKDSELIGFPIRITIGKSFFEKKELTLLDRATWKEDTILFESNEKLYTQLVAILDSMKKRVEP